MSARPEPDPRRARVRMGAGAALILVLAGLAVAVFVTAMAPHGTSTVVAPGEFSASASPAPDAGWEEPDAAVLFVHVLGQVARPGLYELSEGDRAVDAVAAAGGFTATADPGGINLARLLSDGEQLVVPAVGEAAPTSATGVAASGGKINLNSADAAALDTLPRIGPAMAQRIIDWREANGRFSSGDDLLAITGIGEKTLDGLRDLVTT